VCGRFTLTSGLEDVRELVQDAAGPEIWTPRFNIAPSQPVAVIASGDRRQIEFFRWGLVPSWAKDPSIGDRMINARAESVLTKPSFRGPLRRGRCLVLADGFYEWRAEAGRRTKTPIYIRLKSGRPFAFAGLWDTWRSPEGTAISSCAIITTAPNEILAAIHNRMPVILDRSAHSVWLDPRESRADRVTELLGPYPAGEMEAYPVSPLVNNPRNDVPECVVPAAAR
jgi:putative SOS response-associated peptidase YedK